MKFKARVIDVECGENRVLVSRADLKKVRVKLGDKALLVFNRGRIVAILDVTDKLVSSGEVGVYRDVAARLGVSDGDPVELEPATKPESVNIIRKKIAGYKLTREELRLIVKNSINGLLGSAEIAAFVTALEINGMDMDEVEALTREIAETGNVLEFGGKRVYDKHSIGGVPGTAKDTLVIVPIVAASGLLIPKTSSRAITSPAGTADVMEVLAPVALSADEIVEISTKTNGVIAWNEAAGIAPADSIFIRKAEAPLSLDPRCLMLASIMAKKLAMAVDELVIDIPCGEETKVERIEDA